ncbi:MAG TPA: putative glycoside hydrolase [Terriglobales bacterium]|nr:putative glycoside hydrolase [Terriglobales bacterium]
MPRKTSSTLTILAGVLILAAVSLYSLGHIAVSHAASGQVAGKQDVSAMHTTAAAMSAASAKETKKAASLPAQAETPLIVPPDAELHTIAKGETIPGLLYSYLPRTKYMTKPEFEAALRQANPGLKGLFPKPGTKVIIPGIEPQPIVEKSVTVPKDFEVKAIYLTGVMAGSENGLKIIERWKQAGGNAVVFDIKDSDGLLSFPFDNPLAPHSKHVPIRNLPKFTRYLHSLGLHAIARIAIFRDEHIATQHPELAVKSRKTGQPWKENGKQVWTDPSHTEVQNYDIALAKYVADSGADEIQFDYVRFPAEGDQKDAKFMFETEHPKWQRADVIEDFLAKAHDGLKQKNVLLSLDVFGVMAWQRQVDLSHTGQDIVRMAKHCDVLSPMIYPSHFFGMDGYAMPGDAPEHFIGESMDRFVKITAGSGVVLRPWLQAFGWRTKTYSVDYILAQVKTSNARGGIGFLFWTARNDYSKPFGAMPVMAANKPLYYHVPKAPVQNAPVAANAGASGAGTN